MVISQLSPIVCPLTRLHAVCALKNVQLTRTLYTCSASAQCGISGLPRLRHTIPKSRENIEVSTTEWHFVERLIPQKLIPKPDFSPGTIAPSGWVAPSAKPGTHPYFVCRTASHMLPVYIDHTIILQRKITKICKIEGDAFALGQDLHEYLSKLYPSKHINFRVHEPHQIVHVKGDFEQDAKRFLLKKGF